MSATHNPELDALIELYALSALDDQETAEIEAYLRESAHARGLLAQSQVVIASLALSVEQHDPPPGSYDRFIQRVLGPTAQSTASLPAGTPQSPSFWQRLWALFGPQSRWKLGLATLILMVVAGLGSWRVFLDQPDPSPWNQTLAQYQANTALLTDQASRFVALHAPDSAPTTGQTNVILNPIRQAGLLVANGLPQLAANQTYQVWLIADGTPLSMGTFAVDSQGKAVIFMNQLPRSGSKNVVGITIEPAGGSPSPTSNPILVGDIS